MATTASASSAAAKPIIVGGRVTGYTDGSGASGATVNPVINSNDQVTGYSSGTPTAPAATPSPSTPSNPSPASTPSTNPTTAVDTTYQLQPGETTAAYNQRIAAYNATNTPAAPNAGSTSQNASTGTTGASSSTSATASQASPVVQNGTPDTPGTNANAPAGASTDALGVDTSSPGATASSASAQLDQSTADYNAKAAQVSTTIENIQNGTIGLTATEQAQVDRLGSAYQQLIQQQQLANTNAGGVANVRGYQTGAAEYDPTFQVSTIGSIVTAGINKIATLDNELASQTASLEQGFKDSDIAAVKDSFSAYQDAYNARASVLQDTIKSANDAISAAAAAQQKVTDDVNSVAEDAAKNGASAATIAAISSAGSVAGAITAAGSSLQTSSNPDIAQYLFYSQQAQAAGQTPQSYTEYEAAQAQIADSQAYGKAYATAAGTAAGSASALPSGVDVSTGAGLGGTTGGGSILSATGLSIGAFNYLTGNTSALSRLTASQRNQIMTEAENFANKNGVDVSTLSSQYTALNDVLASNIARENNAKIKGEDVTQTAAQLAATITTSDASGLSNNGFFGLGSHKLSAENVADLAAGKAVNNPYATTYGTDIGLLTNDLAGYLAAARSNSPTGAATPTEQDTADAAGMVSAGLDSGSLAAFQLAISGNVSKIAAVSGDAVTDTQKQIWELFGVGDSYVSPTNTADTMLQQGATNPLNITAGSTSQSTNGLGI